MIGAAFRERQGFRTVKESKACGGWPSPIGSSDLVEGALRLSAPKIHGGVLYWLEGRPTEGGRQVLMAADLNDAGGVRAAREVCPPEANVRTRVHEYGGGEYAVTNESVFYVDDRDGRIHRGELGGGHAKHIQPISHPGSRFADLVVSPDGRWLVAVEEAPRTDREPENRLVAFELDKAATRKSGTALAPCTIAAGHDFYASPVFLPTSSEDRGQLAFIAWDHPNMPWNGTWLETIAWGAAGPRGDCVSRGGGMRESIFQPRYSSNGSLYAVSDTSNWWNLAHFGERGAESVHSLSAELGRAQWVFGMSAWDFLSEGVAVASATREGCDDLVRLDLETGIESVWPTPFCSIGGIEAQEGWVACIAGSASEAAGLYVARADGGAFECVRAGSKLCLPESAISRAAIRSFDLSSGRTTHAFVYPPTSEVACARPDERPPLLVKSHGGPTAATSAAFDPRIQYWTSRGFAVADVNYGGSTGYGRAYRDVLERAWGIVDVEDCVAVAQALGAEGFVDSARLAISGGSAGGYTTLCALTFHSVFAAGASHYGIGDLEALVRDTHKFESRYTDWLVGVWPEERERYVARSPIHHDERLSCPVIFFQGLEDRVVPPNQAEAMVQVLARRGIAHSYVPFEGEQHGFRRAENIRTALDGELYFYSRVFGFEADRPGPVHVIGGRPE